MSLKSILGVNNLEKESILSNFLYEMVTKISFTQPRVNRSDLVKRISSKNYQQNEYLILYLYDTVEKMTLKNSVNFMMMISFLQSLFPFEYAFYHDFAREFYCEQVFNDID